MSDVKIVALVEGKREERKVDHLTHLMLKDEMIKRRMGSGELFAKIIELAIEAGKNDFLSNDFVVECLKKI